LDLEGRRLFAAPWHAGSTAFHGYLATLGYLFATIAMHTRRLCSVSHVEPSDKQFAGSVRLKFFAQPLDGAAPAGAARQIQLLAYGNHTYF
jgi:hypothetical protein